MNEHDLRERFNEERTENCALFMKTASFWRTVVTGIVLIAGLSSAVFAWGLRVNANVKVNESNITQSDKRIDRLEKVWNGKLDTILEEVRKE